MPVRMAKAWLSLRLAESTARPKQQRFRPLELTAADKRDRQTGGDGLRLAWTPEAEAGRPVHRLMLLHSDSPDQRPCRDRMTMILPALQAVAVVLRSSA